MNIYLIPDLSYAKADPPGECWTASSSSHFLAFGMSWAGSIFCRRKLWINDF